MSSSHAHQKVVASPHGTNVYQFMKGSVLRGLKLESPWSRTQSSKRDLLLALIVLICFSCAVAFALNFVRSIYVQHKLGCGVRTSQNVGNY